MSECVVARQFGNASRERPLRRQAQPQPFGPCERRQRWNSSEGVAMAVGVDQRLFCLLAAWNRAVC